MRAVPLEFVTRGVAGQDLLWAPEAPRPQRPLSFRERGFSFIPLRPQHLALYGAIYGDRSMPRIDEVVGRAMVDADYMPLGAVLVYFEPDVIEPEYGQRIFSGKNWVYGHFGDWLRRYPKDILRDMSEVTDQLREGGVFDLHCTADRTIEGSDKLAKWLGGVATGEIDELGPIYQIDLRKCKI
jgi:hypothetical protein